MKKSNRKHVLLAFVLGLSFMVIVGAVTNLTNLVLSGYQTIGTYLTVGTYSQVGTESRAPEFQLGIGAALDSTGRIIMKVRNKSGATIPRGRVVAWDTTEVILNEIKILPNIAYTDTGSTFTTEGVPNGIKITVRGTPSTDTVYIYGTAMTNSGIAAAIDTLALGTTTDDVRYSDYVWTGFDSIFADSAGDAGFDSVSAHILPYRGVIMGIVTSLNPAGVVISSSITDNSVGDICVFGEVEVRTKTGAGTYVRHGWPLAVGASGTALPLAATQLVTDSISLNYSRSIIGWGLGSKDDVSDTATVWMFINTM